MSRVPVAIAVALVLLSAGCGSDRSQPRGSPAPQPSATPGEPSPSPAVSAPTPPPEPTPTGTPESVTPVALLATQPAVMRSDDGGATWTVAVPLANASVVLADANVGWAHVRGDVFVTRDGGRTWASRGEALDLSLVRWMRFLDPDRGVLHGTLAADGDEARAVLRYTVDGGASWQPALLDDAARRRLEDGVLSRVCLDGSGGGLATGYESLSSSASIPAILVTGDGGASWSDASARIDPGIEAPFASLACPGGSDFWLVTHGGRLLHSRDAGGSWQAEPLPESLTQDGRAIGVGFVDPDRGFLAAADASDLVLLRTFDGGRTWREQLRLAKPGTSGVVFDFADAEHGLAGIVAPRGYPPFSFDATPIPATVLVTDDGGTTWREVSLEDRWSPRILGAVSNVAIRSVAYPQDDAPPSMPGGELPTALLGARELGVARSPDGGVRWQESFALRSVPGSGVPEPPLLRALHLVDRDRGFAVGDGGLILRTDDGGRTWASQAQNVPLPNARNVSYDEVVFLDAERGIVGGGADPDVTNFTRSPVLLHTTDGGATWSPAAIAGLDSPPAGDSRVPRHACFTRTGRGVAADTVSGTFSSGGTVTTGFEGRLVLVTNDAGASWTSIERGMALPDDFRSWDVACAGEADLWLVGGLQRVPSDVATPYVLHSSDGGATWGEVDVPLPSALTAGRSVSSASFVSPELGWLAAPPLGDPLVLLRTLDGGESWQTSLTADGTDFADARVVFVDDRNGVVAASRVLGPLNQQPAAFVTRDGGATWSVTDFGYQPTSRALLDVTLAR